MSNKRLITYLVITLFCGIFSAVYEHFSHGVYSNFMVYLFAIPLFLGVIPELLVRVVPIFRIDSPWVRLLQNFAIAIFAVGSAFQGVVEIYGTTSRYTMYYFVIGIGLLASSVAVWFIVFFTAPNKKSCSNRQQFL